MLKEKCEQCKHLPEGEVMPGHDHRPPKCKVEGCENRRQKGSSRCEVHVGIKRKVIPETHGAD